MMQMARLQGSQDPLGGGVGEGREIHACELGLLMCLFQACEIIWGLKF